LSQFLDEVAELNLDMQVKFLRVLQDGYFERVGAEQRRHVDIRVVSATNTNLAKAISEGKFRKDLYYRLCVMPVDIPPLRERRGDIETLAEHFLTMFREESYRSDLKFSPKTLPLLKAYDWPGNIRELQNIIQFALVKCRGHTIEPEHLPPAIYAKENYGFVRHRRPSKLREELVIEALQKAGGNRRRAAEFLGISRSTLYRFFEKQEENSKFS
jgi:transcriptional regulator with PAS, ATPase and Fis domain